MAPVHADELIITLRQVTAGGLDKEVGTVKFRDHQYGLSVVPDLRDLTPGPLGAHIHENPDCGPATNHGTVVPGGVLGALAVSIAAPLMPWTLAFAAGAMLLIISDEIIPETHRRGFENLATFSLFIGFACMMYLDATLG